MKICLIFLMLLLFLSNSLAGYCQIDGPIAKEAVKKDTLALLSSSQFKKLEENAKRYRVKKERFPDGGWKLSKNNNLWATELLKKWKKLNMVGVTY